MNRYPAGGVERDRWILAHRGPRAPLDSSRAYASAWEEEADASGALVPTAVVFLTNKECPFRCLMCDLWRHTLERTVDAGSIPLQIRRALDGMPAARQVKLYNAGSFFDPGAIPVEDDEDIAREVNGFERVIVEAHPAFLAGPYGERCLWWRDRLAGALEVAVGLETAHEQVLARLNKRMTLDTFRQAAAFLVGHGIGLRVFILLRPPFMSESDGVEWACRSIDVAIECGADVCSVIPTRAGNGALEALGSEFEPPSLRSLERVIDYGLTRGRARIVADLWDVDRLCTCGCAAARVARLDAMNKTQRILPGVACGCDAA